MDTIVKVEITAVTFSKEATDVMIEHLSEGYPEEACGFLGGHGSEITRAIPMSNVAMKSARFALYQFDPLEMVAAYQTLESEGLDFIGTFHSHPRSSAYPSGIDTADAREDCVYTIVSLRDLYNAKKDNVVYVGAYRILKDDYYADSWMTVDKGDGKGYMQRWIGDESEIMTLDVTLLDE